MRVKVYSSVYSISSICEHFWELVGLVCLHPKFGMAQSKVGLAQPKFGMVQPKVGLAQPKFGMVQLKVGIAQWHGLCHLRLVLVDQNLPSKTYFSSNVSDPHKQKLENIKRLCIPSKQISLTDHSFMTDSK